MKQPKQLIHDMIGHNNIKLCDKCGLYNAGDERTAEIIKKRHLPKCECK